MELGHKQDKHAGVEVGAPHLVPVTVPWTYAALTVPSPPLWSEPGHSEVPLSKSVARLWLRQVCFGPHSLAGRILRAGRQRWGLYSGGARLENQGAVNWDGPDTVRNPFSSPGPRPPIICLVSREVGVPLQPVRFSIYLGRARCLSEDGGGSGKSPSPRQTATSRCPDVHLRDP